MWSVKRPRFQWIARLATIEYGGGSCHARTRVRGKHAIEQAASTAMASFAHAGRA
jgi:hypothetical protein